MQLQSKLADMQALITTTEDVFNNKGTDGFTSTTLNSRIAFASSLSTDNTTNNNRMDNSFAASNGGTGGSHHPHSILRHQSSNHAGFRSHHMKHTTPQVDMALCPITEGRMTKKGGETATFTGGRPWRERYCKLEGTELVWYEKQGSKVVKDRFPITSSVQVTSGATDRQHKNKSIKFDFELTDPEKNESRSLYSDTEQEAKNWIATIEYVVEKCIEVEANAAATEAAQGGEYAEEASLQANLYAIDGMLANLQASVAGSEINSVPQDVAAFMVPLDPAEIEQLKDEAQCHTAYGSGLYEAVRGEPASFIIQACTSLGDPKNNGGDNFIVTLESEDYPDLKWDLIPQDNGDGTYSIEYTPTRIGEWSLRVLVNGQYDIYGSPFHPIIQRAPTSSTHCLVKGEGTTIARIDSTNKFTIVARDIYDDERGVGGDSFEITILGPGLANPIIDNGDGTYTVSYDIDTQSAVFKSASVVKPPTLELHIALNNPGFPYPRIIKDSPFTPRIEMVPRVTPVAPPPPPPVAQTSSNVVVAPPPPPPPSSVVAPPPPPSQTVVVSSTVSPSVPTAVTTESVSVPAPAPPSPPVVAVLPPPPPSATIELPQAVVPTVAVVEVPSVPAPVPIVPAPVSLPPPPMVSTVVAPPTVLPPPSMVAIPLPVPPTPVIRPDDDPEIIRVRAELAAKEKEIREAMVAVDEQRKRLEEERRKVEEDNRQVTERMARLREVSTKVKELSEKNIEQARAMQMVKSQLAAAAQVSPQQHHNNSLSSPQYIPTPSQPNFDGSSSNINAQSQVNNNANNISPGTTYTRQTYNTYDDNASIYTRVTAPPQAYAAVLNSPAYIQLQSMEPVMFTNPNNNSNPATDAVESGYNHGTAPQSSTAVRNYTSTESPGELFDIDVMALFDKHRIAVRDLWSFYAAMSRGSDGLRGTANGLDIKRFVILMQDYDICPTFVTKKELKQIFTAASRAHSGSNTATTTNDNDENNLVPLSYAAFVEALGRTALTALAKPAFVTLYPTAFDKVKVLLEMWGIADNRKLQEIQNNLREAGNTNPIPSGQSVGGKSKTASVATSGRKSRSNRQ